MWVLVSRAVPVMRIACCGGEVNGFPPQLMRLDDQVWCGPIRGKGVMAKLGSGARRAAGAAGRCVPTLEHGDERVWRPCAQGMDVWMCAWRDV